MPPQPRRSSAPGLNHCLCVSPAASTLGPGPRGTGRAVHSQVSTEFLMAPVAVTGTHTVQTAGDNGRQDISTAQAWLSLSPGSTFPQKSGLFAQREALPRQVQLSQAAGPTSAAAKHSGLCFPSSHRAEPGVPSPEPVHVIYPPLTLWKHLRAGLPGRSLLTPAAAG